MSAETSLWAALIAARSEIKPFPKTADNPFFHSKYVPLGDVLGAVVPILAAHGLFLTATTETSDAGVSLAVSIVHEMTAERATCNVPLVGLTDMQKVAGGFTYGLRVGTCALLALELEDDDDGNKASAPPPARTQGRPAQAPQRPQAAASQEAKAAAQVRVDNPAAGDLKRAICPRCKVQGSIIESKPEYGGGWKCWTKKMGTLNGVDKAGCGATFDSNPALWTPADYAAAQRVNPARPLAVSTDPPGTRSPDLAPDYSDADPPPPGDDDLPF